MTEEKYKQDMSIMQAFVDFYREKLLENGFNEAQLRAFDVDICEKYVKEHFKMINFTDEEWEEISNLAYNDFEAYD